LAFSYRLGEIPPYHPDENFYVESGRNMVEGGDYITPVYHEENRFAKPILFYWLVSAAYTLGGIGLVSARMVSALAGALSVWITWMIARRLFGPRPALLAALILPGCYLHFQISRWAITDMTLTLFILGALLFFIRGYQDEKDGRWDFYIFHFFLALGFMIKGPPALLIPLLTVGSYCAVIRDWGVLRRMRIVPGVLIILGLNVPWFATMFLLHGDEFTRHILGAEIRDRVVHNVPFSFYYVGVLFRYYLPWSLFFIAALLVYSGMVPFPGARIAESAGHPSPLGKRIREAWRNLKAGEGRPLLFCFLWIIITLLLFTIFRIQHSRYMLSASAPLAMVLGRFFVTWAEHPNPYRTWLVRGPLYLSLALYLVLSLAAGIAEVVLNPVFHVPFRMMLFPLVTGFGVVALLFFYASRKPSLLVPTLAIFQLLLLTSMSGDLHPFLDRYPMKHLAEAIRSHGTGSEKIGAYRLGSHRARLGILTGQMTVNLYDAPQLQSFVKNGARVFVVMEKEAWERQFQNSGLHNLAGENGWKKDGVEKGILKKILRDGLRPHMPELTEEYVLLSNT